MQSTKKILPKSMVEYTIELSEEELVSYIPKTAQRISRQARIPGFRSGKVPIELLRSHIGEEAFLQELGRSAVAGTVYTVLEKEAIATVGHPRIEIIQLAFHGPCVYTALCSVWPGVRLGEYKNIQVEQRNLSVEEKKIDSEIKNLQHLYATEAVVLRGAQMGDRVEMDMDIYVDYVAIEGGQMRKQSYILGEKNIVPGFEQNILGMKQGEEKVFALTFPKEYIQKNLENRTAEIKVKVSTVYARTLPEVNDAFARRAFGVDTVAALREQIRMLLLRDIERKELDRVQLELLDTLLQRSDFDEIPDVLIERELDGMMDELQKEVERRGGRIEDYYSHIKKSKEEIRFSFRDRAEQRVKSALLLRFLVEQEQIDVSSEEIEHECSRLRKKHKGSSEQAQDFFSAEDKQFVRTSLLHRKVFERLLEYCGHTSQVTRNTF